jgi:CBS domain-containing protein
MQVHEVMSRPVDVVDASTTARDAARRMRDENIGSLPVGKDGQLIGMVTDRDIVARAVAENRLPSNTAVSTVMSEGVFHCLEDDSLEEAARIMAEHQPGTWTPRSIAAARACDDLGLEPRLRRSLIA